MNGYLLPHLISLLGFNCNFINEEKQINQEKESKPVIKSIILLLLTLALMQGNSMAQTLTATSTNDYISKVSGTWNSTSTWLNWNGTTWVDATIVPNATTANVYIQTGHTITVDLATVNVNNLYMAGSEIAAATAVSFINLLSSGSYNTLVINGRLSVFYQSPALVSGSTSAIIAGSFATWTGSSTTQYPINSGQSTGTTYTASTQTFGTVRFTGSANQTALNTNWSNGGIIAANVKFDYGIYTCTLATTFRAANIEVVSGTLATSTRLGCGIGATTNLTTSTSSSHGNFLVSSGATFTTSYSSTAQILSQSTGSQCRSFTVAAGGTFNVASTGSWIDAAIVSLQGTVNYTRSGTQTLIRPSTGQVTGGTQDATGYYAYNNLTISGSGVKSLSSAISVSGTFSVQGTATLGTGTISSIAVVNGGTGYSTSGGTWTTTGGGGTGATGTYTAPAGIITGYTITSVGSGYTSVPTIVLSGSGNSATSTVIFGTTLSYGTTATLAYESSTAQTPAILDWPITSGPANVTINNASGVTIASSFARSITGTLNLTAGIFTNSASVITLANGATLKRTSGSISNAPTYGTGAGVNITYDGSASVTSVSALELTPAAGKVNNLTVNFSTASQTLNVPSALTSILGNLTTNSNSTVALSGNLSIAGNLANSGTITQGSNVLTFNSSSAAQTISSSTVLGSLTINNTFATTPTVSLSSAISTSGTLTLTAGKLVTTSTNLLTITNTAAAAIVGTSGGTTTSDFSASNYIQGPLARTLPQNLSSGSTYVFPVGGTSGYNAFELVNPTTSNSASLAVVQAQAFNASNSGSATGLILNTNVYWNASVTTNASSFTNTTIRLTDAGYSPATLIVGASTLNGTYTSLGTATVDGATNSLLSPSVTSSFSPFLVLASVLANVVDPAQFSATTSSNTQINLSASANASSNSIVVVSNGTGSFSTPANGVAAGAVGASLAGGTIVYKGSASGLSSHTGLTGNTTYYYKVFSVDGSNNYSPGLTATAITYPNVPTTSGISPSSATVAGSGFTITVTGTNFTNASTVTWGGAALTTTYVSATSLTATVPSINISSSASSATVAVGVSTTNASASSNTQTFTISIPTPTSSSVSPLTALAGGSDFTITLNGTNFVSGVSAITWNGTALTTTFVSSSQLTATVTAARIASTGTALVRVVNSLPGSSVTSSNTTFTIGTTATIFTTAGTTSTWTCPADVTSVTVECWGAGGGGGYAQYRNTGAGGGAGGSYVNHTFAVTPGQTYNLTVGAGGAAGYAVSSSTGSTFAADITARYNGGAGGSSYFGNTTQGATAGASILATGGGGGITTTGTGISSTSPLVGFAGGTSSVSGNIPSSGANLNVAGTNGEISVYPTSATISSGGGGAGACGGAGGSGFHPNNYVSTVVGLPGTAPGGGGAGALDGTIFAGALGGLGADGQVKLTYNTKPIITSTTSLDAIFNTAFSYNIVATNNATSYSVQGGSSLPSGLTLNASTGLISGTPTVTGSFNTVVVATNTAGLSGTATLSFTITCAPAITSSLTATATVGSSFTYTIAATNTPTSYAIASGTLPSGLSLNTTSGIISGTPSSGTSGVYSVGITASNTCSTSPVATLVFTVLDIPTTTSISPTSAAINGSSFTITVNGSNFLSGLSTVTWGGVALTTTYVSATQLTAVVPSANIASTISSNTSNIGVTTTGVSTSSNTQLFTVNVAPTINGITPSTAIVGGAGFTLTVNGASFVSGASIAWNGTPLTTTFVSSTQLTATISSSYIASYASSTVGVTNTGAGTTGTTTTVFNTVTSSLVSFNTAGDNTWTCPAGVSSVIVEAWGGGGGGGFASTYSAGGGGAGGAYVRYSVPVTAGTVYNLTVGSGGAGGTSTTVNGSTGLSSFFGNPTAGSSTSAIVRARAGGGGTSVGTAGTASVSSVGFAGGTPNSPNTPSASSGGTVSSYGTNGGTSSLSGSGAGGTSANGAAGGASLTNFLSNTIGNAGSAPGGGGGGAINYTVTAGQAGGAGGAGKLVLSFSPVPVINSSLTAVGSIGAPISPYTITATNSPTSFSQSGLPAGLALDASTGIITGTPSFSLVPDDYDVIITATNVVGSSESKTLVFTISSAAAPSITSSLSTSGSVGATYAGYSILTTPTATSYNATGLPAGLTINTTTGVISGTIATTGLTSVTTVTAKIFATKSGATSNANLVFTINPATVYYYDGSGGLDVATNWHTSNGGVGVVAPSGVFTQSGVTFNILTDATTQNNTSSSMTIGSGSNITLGNNTTSGKTLTITNAKAIASSVTINISDAASGNNKVLIQNTTIPSFGTLGNSATVGSMVEYNGATAQTITATNYGNLVVSNTSATGATLPAGTTNATAINLTVSAGATMTFGSTTTTSINVSSSATISGTVIFPAGITAFINGAGRLSLNSGSTLYIGNASGFANSTSAGNIRTAGTRTLSTNISLIYQGNAAQSIGSGVPSTVANLTINTTNSSTVTLAQALSVTGKLSVTAGTFATGGFLTLKSTSIANTAVVDVVCTTCAITGNTIVERFIPSGYRGYRDIAPQVYNSSSTTGSIFKNWQENGDMPKSTSNTYTSGTGIFITGTTATLANTGSNYANATYSSGQPASDANGLDYSINGAASAFTYTNGSGFNAGFSAITNTKTTNLDAFSGYRVLVRGDRSFNLATTPIISYYLLGLRMVNATKLRTTGNLVYGPVTYSTTGVTGTVNGAASATLSTNGLTSSTTNGFSMVANPYACPVYWGSSSNDQATSVFGLSTNINGSYWYFDPTAGSTGKYIAFNALTGGAVVLGSTYPGSYNGSTIGTGYIQPGQAFFVQNSSSSPSVVFTEACKATSPTTRLTSIFGANKPLSKIYLGLKKEDSTNVYVQKDGAAIAFASNFGNTTYGPQDALKFGNATDNLYISDKGKNLSIDGRLPAIATDVLPIVLNKMSGKNYQLVIDASDYDANGYVPVLRDNYRGIVKELSFGIDTITFVVDTSKVASYFGRFSIGFKPTTLAVNSIAASASLSNKIATISWNTVGEKGVSRFEVEKSTDAKAFTKIGQSAAKNTTTAVYTSTDNNATAAINYYRIKAISEVGTVSYSNVVKVAASDAKLSTYSLYPNPLKGSKLLNLAIGNLSAGKYTVTITNILGQRVQESSISHQGGSATHAITITNTLAAGTYSVTVRDANNQSVFQSNISVN